ncbi:restriction endonuclease subunit S [Geobacillus stearothermophilus]|nr:restriction endonuclease subunit S [Geobacillus stearothermophilus]
MPIREVKLGDICTIKGGYAFKSSEFIKSGIPVVKIANIVGREIDFNEDSSFLSPANLEQYREYVVNKGDILVALSGATTGKFGIYKLDEIALLNQRVAKIVSKNEQVCPKYLFYYMDKLQNKILQKAGGAAQPNISPKEIAQFTIPLPSIEIQNRISEILDKAQELIDKRKAQIEVLDQLTQSVFLEMFGDLRTNQKGWKIVELSEIVQVDANLVDDITNYVNYPLVGIDNIEKNTGNLINIKTVGESDVKGSKYFFSREHILYSKIRPYLNKVASPSFEGLCSTDAYPLKINKEKANKQFILNILRSKDFVSYAVKHSKGANIPRIDQKQLLNYKTILPDLNTQNQFENIVKKIEIQKEIIKKSLRELENTFNSLMQRAFKGELFND